ncbi:MAG: anti-sigma factor antagonist [Solirubrobacteraceae bacterium]|nr:anti-sigma factor antagonist [Solirubrobacteraceae bacterium]
MSANPPALRIRSEAAAGGHVLTLSGELDLASAGVLDTAIAELCTDGAELITLEMGELEFMDSTGLRSVLVGQELCEVNGCELMIGALSPQVRRLFEVSGVGEKLTFRTDLAKDA